MAASRFPGWKRPAGEAFMPAAVNIGNDTDTVAAICGSIVGAYTGAGVFDPHFQRELEAVNGYRFHQLADNIFQMVRAAAHNP